MKLPKDQPFWTSVILHAVVLLGLFLVTIVQAIKPKERSHVFELIDPPSEVGAELTSPPQELTPPSPVVTPPVELAPVPEVNIPEQAPPAPQPPRETPKPQPIRETSKPTPPVEQTMSYEDFLKKNPIKEPKRPTETRQKNSDPPPVINVPEAYVPNNLSPVQPDRLSPQTITALGAYSSRLRSKIDVAWQKPPQLAGVKVSATVEFYISASGQISNIRLKPSSGNAAFDQSVLAAFRRVTGAGPTPSGQGHTFSMTFRMSD